MWELVKVSGVVIIGGDLRKCIILWVLQHSVSSQFWPCPMLELT